jgi:hypothetical protein
MSQGQGLLTKVDRQDTKPQSKLYNLSWWLARARLFPGKYELEYRDQDEG